MKLVLKIFGCLILLVVVAVGASFYYLDTIIKEAVVRVGPEVTGTNVELQSVDLSIFGGTAALEGLVVGNPDGYEDPNVFSLGEVAVELDINSITEDVILIHSVYIDSPQIVYESSEAGDNFQTLLENITNNLGATEQTEQEESASAKKIIIERFVLANGGVNVRHSLLPSPAQITLPDLELTDIGKKTNGATAKEAAGQIISQITDAAMSAVTGSQLIEQARAKIAELEAEARAKIEQKLDEEIDEKVGGKVTEKLEELGIGEEETDALKGLFNGF